MSDRMRGLRNTLRTWYMRYLNPILRCPYVLILPAVLVCLTFSIIPTIMSVRNSFYKVDYVMKVDQFVGLSNFKSIFADENFLLVFRNTVVFTAVTVVFAIPLAVLIAFSRLYLYVHFPTDVLAAAVLGAAIGLGAVAVAKKIAPGRAAQG